MVQLKYVQFIISSPDKRGLWIYASPGPCRRWGKACNELLSPMLLICTRFLGELKEEIGRMLSVCLEVTARYVVADLFQVIGLTVPSEMYICF